MKGLVIFDLDGTLLNSLPDITDCLNVTLKKYGFPLKTEKDVLNNICHGAADLVKKCINAPLEQEKFQEILSYYTEYYAKCGSPKSNVYSGMDKALQKLSERGYKLAILTNKQDLVVQEIARKFFSTYKFDYVIGIKEGIHRKPNPESTQFLMEKLGANKENTYLIGDGETDVQTAINAGINGIAVTYGYRTKEQLKLVGATTFIDKPVQLLDLIK